MSANYSSKAENALELAKRNARSFGQNYIGTEHILLGLLEEVTGVASLVLSENGISRKSVVDIIEQLIAPEAAVTVRERDGYTPKARQLLTLSEELAKKYSNDEVGTEHILLAILKTSGSVAYRILATMGVSANKLISDVMTAMGLGREAISEEITSAGYQTRFCSFLTRS